MEIPRVHVSLLTRTMAIVLLCGRLSPAQAPSSTEPAPPRLAWPAIIHAGGMQLVVYKPQVDSWKKDKLEARSAVSASLPGVKQDVLGVVAYSARTDVDKATRTVALSDVKIDSVDFPSMGSGQEMLKKAVSASLIQWPRTVSLDHLLASLSIGSAEMEAESAVLNNDPPKIFYSSRPAVLVLIDGDPDFRDVPGSKYRRVINTPSLILFDPASAVYYLDGNTLWMTAGALNGPWSIAANPPADLNALRTQLVKGEQSDPQGQAGPTSTAPPDVYVSTVPAELIQTNGPLQYAPIPNTGLVYATNSDTDIFVNVKTKDIYVLLAGRWFQSKSLNGPWTYVPGNKLPRDFLKIPPDGPKASVLVSIPGTIEAKEGVVANSVPQMAIVRRDEATLTVPYDGAPQFGPIAGRSLEYAFNTPIDVIHAEGRYYAVENGVWFVSDAPTGPWAVADKIPDVIYTIPPNSPLYRVRFVCVYRSTPDYVYFGYTPGYLGSFIENGVVVFGTGWWDSGWCGDFWFGWPWTWGLGFQYSYWPSGWFPGPARHPWWYHHGPPIDRVFYGQRDTGTGSPEGIRANSNAYSRWTGAGVRPIAVTPPAGPATLSAHLDFYAGKDGKVYEAKQDGWYARDSAGNSKKVNPPAGLNEQRQSRDLGNARTGEFQRGGGGSMPHTMAPHMGGGGGGGGGRRR
ncbi:MAG TPA: hypothetical protein VIY49_05945 [Bryobacteraceae bacterium]